MENNISKEQFRLKELIVSLIDWLNMLKKQWLKIAMIGLIGALLGILIAILVKPKYDGRITFVLEDSKSGGALGAYAGVAAQFGIDLGGGSGGVFQGENILLLLKSQLLVKKVLLSKYDTDGKISLADQFLSISGLKEKWNSKPQLANISLPPVINNKPIKYSRLQDSIISVIHEKMLEDYLDVQKVDKKLSFIVVSCISKDEMFSKLFSERLVSEATDLYVMTKTKRSKTNVDKLSVKADSLQNLMNAKSYYVANAQDLNLNPVRKIGTVSTELAARDRVILQTIYGEVVKNLEMAKMTLSSETPIIQIIDSPELPLKKIQYKFVKSAVLGGFLGFFTCVIFLTLGSVYKKIMA